MTSSFAKDNSQRSTHYVIDARYIKDAFHKLNVPFHPALKYIVSYIFHTIKWSCTDPFWKRSQIFFFFSYKSTCGTALCMKPQYQEPLTQYAKYLNTQYQDPLTQHAKSLNTQRSYRLLA